MAKKKQKPARVTPSISQQSGQDSVNHRLWIGLCLLLTLLAFLPVFSAGFVNWDDGDYSFDNAWIRSFSNFSMFFTEPVQGNYHPLTMITMALNYAISGNNAWSYHVLNLLLHLANTGLAYWLAWRLSGKKFWAALVTGLLFGIHPMHVESVAWVSERKDVLYSLFFMLGMLAHLRYVGKPGIKSYLPVAGWFVLSLLSKPAAVVFPVALLAVDYWMKRPLNFKLITEKIPLFALSLAMGLLTVHAQTLKGATDIENVFPMSSTIFFGFYAFMMYWVKLIFPVNLCPFYAFPAINEALPAVYYLSPAFGIATGIFLFLKKSQTRLFAFVVAFFLVNIALVLQFFTVGSAIIADRYAYMPYWASFFLIGYGMNRLVEDKKLITRQVAFGILGVAALLLTALSYRQSSVWKNGAALWDHAIEVCPSSRAYTQRAFVYRENKDNANALVMCNKAMEVNKVDDSALNIRGNIYFDTGENEKALADLNRAIEINPKNANAYNSRGAVYGTLGQYEKALADLSRAIEMKPDNDRSYVNRGLLYFKMGKYNECIKDYTHFLTLKPSNNRVWNDLGNAYRGINDFNKAIEAFNKAIEIAPNEGMYYLTRSHCYFTIGNIQQARTDVQQAQRLGTQAPPDYLLQLQ